MNAYVKYFDKSNKCMNHLVNDKEILEKYNEIWKKNKDLFEKGFDSEPVYNDKCTKAKINLYNTNFCGNKTPVEGKHYTCFSVILLDSIVNADENIVKIMQICNKEEKYNEYNEWIIKIRWVWWW